MGECPPSEEDARPVQQPACRFRSYAQALGDFDFRTALGQEAECCQLAVAEQVPERVRERPVDVPVFGFDADAVGPEAGGDLFRDDDRAVASATARDVDVDAKAAAGHHQE